MAHGGMLAAARRLFPHAPAPLLDLSTGINSVSYPLAPLSPLALTRLPDADDEEALRRAAALAYGVADPAMVVAAPGTQILISLLPYLLDRTNARVAILSPTYGEHEAAWRAAGGNVLATSDFSGLAQSDIAVVCNPNNPDGRRIDPAKLLQVADRLVSTGGMLVVDEAFADLEPSGLSLAGALPHKGIVVLRSFGKSYGLAGLRLGFVLAEPVLAARLRTALGPWAVSGPALAAGLQALPDHTWRATTIGRLARDIDRLDRLVTTQSMTLIGGTRLYRFYEGDGAGTLYDRLGEAGILARRFAGHPRRLRFGLPGNEAEWLRLAAVLQP